MSTSGSNGSMKQTLPDEICIVPFGKEKKISMPVILLYSGGRGWFTAHINA